MLFFNAEQSIFAFLYILSLLNFLNFFYLFHEVFLFEDYAVSIEAIGIAMQAIGAIIKHLKVRFLIPIDIHFSKWVKSNSSETLPLCSIGNSTDVESFELQFPIFKVFLIIILIKYHLHSPNKLMYSSSQIRQSFLCSSNYLHLLSIFMHLYWDN